MTYKLRDYQKQASDAAIRFFKGKSKRNGILVLPTGSGKSLIIADIAAQLNKNVVVFQPSKEILEQNFAKLQSYGVMDCSIYSASLRRKEISRITFATIGSVANHMEEFNHFDTVIIDECHSVNPQGGRYKDFFDASKRKILGLTATPYRLTSSRISLDENGKYNPEYEPSNMCILKFLTRTRPKVFHDVLYQVSIQELLRRGYLAKLQYFDMSIVNQNKIKRNSTGMDFDDDSLELAFENCKLSNTLVGIVKRLQKPKNGVKRKGILVFTKFLKESENLCREIDGCVMVHGSTPAKERAKILEDFKSGKIEVLTNVGILTTGFDYPELDTVVLARPTMSLSLYYQIVGRIIRPYKDKVGWVIDLAGNIKRFGKVENIYLTEPKPGEYMIKNANVEGKDKQLTNIYF